MELVAFINPTGVILASWPHGGAHAHGMSALLGTLRLEELPTEAASCIQQQITVQGWVLLPMERVKALDVLGMLRPSGHPMW